MNKDDSTDKREPKSRRERRSGGYSLGLLILWLVKKLGI